MQLIPAILASSVQEYEATLAGIHGLKRVERVQVDFVDEFFSNQTLPLAFVDVHAEKRWKFDAHLMVDPEVVWDEIAQAKIAGFERIIVQVESLDDQSRFIEETREYKRGLAIDLESAVDEIEDTSWAKLDVVLLMAVEAGFGGQLFDNRVLEKVKELTALRTQGGHLFRICIDGGVEELHLPLLEKLGVDEVVVGAHRLESFSS